MPGKQKVKNTADDKKKIKEMTKAAEDKTFGMKNKNKSKAVQKVMKGMASANINGGYDAIVTAQYEEKKKKEALMQERKFLADIKLGDIRAVAQEDVADPSQTICPYFKAGLCQKGRRCKFSHQTGADVKASLYTDLRDADGGDNMENWDQKKLEEAVNFNMKKYVNPNATDLPCHNFLNAIAEKKYGWFWVCPNGANCKYKHALPPGFVLKEKGAKEEKLEFNVERDIDAARDALGNKSTPVTYEKYLEWREKRKIRKQKEKEAETLDRVKKAGVKVAKGKKIMTGKSLFVFDPSLFQDDADAAGAKDIKETVEGEEDATLNTGGKKWEAKKVEEVPEEDEGEGEKKEEEGDKPADADADVDVDVDEDVFADEELPDDL